MQKLLQPVREWSPRERSPAQQAVGTARPRATAEGGCRVLGATGTQGSE